MKKVLLIAYHFPPRPGIGSQRPYKLSKSFPRYGWESIVLTAQLPGIPPEGIRVLETAYIDRLGRLKSIMRLGPKASLHEQLGIKIDKSTSRETWKTKLIKHLYLLTTFPDPQIGWRSCALNAAHELLKREKIDVILSTSSPVTSHLIARQLKLTYNVPWIADFRDPWTQNPHYEKLNCIKWIERGVELRTLAHADLIVTVTEPWVKLLKSLHRSKDIVCITNGFDEDDFPKQPCRLTDKFSLTYTGKLYNGKRDPDMLFKALRLLIDEKSLDESMVEIRLFCPEHEWLLEEIRRYGLSDVVKVYGCVPREEVLMKQRESQALLLLLWEEEDKGGLCPAKLYEYLGAGRPILAVASEQGVTKIILEKTGAGRLASDLTTLKKALLDMYHQYREHGAIKASHHDSIKEYNFSSLAYHYCQLLDRLI